MDAPAPLTLRTEDADGTRDFGRALAAILRAARLDELTIELRGDLGAGKTVLVSGLALGLGLSPAQRIVSPTFTIARAYALDAGALRELHHVDAYRLCGGDDLEAAGFEDMCGTGRLVCVEWGENVEDALPADRLQITLRPTREGPGPAPEVEAAPRRIVVSATGAVSAALLAALRAQVEEPA